MLCKAVNCITQVKNNKKPAEIKGECSIIHLLFCHKTAGNKTERQMLYMEN